LLAVELLQYVISEALQLGNLTMPISHGSGMFPVVQYEDDTILLLSADRHQILFLKNLLEQFSTSIGLKINYHKSYMIPLNVSDTKI
jgi:Leu/Phe-tRNA-protein transferase